MNLPNNGGKIVYKIYLVLVGYTNLLLYLKIQWVETESIGWKEYIKNYTNEKNYRIY